MKDYIEKVADAVNHFKGINPCSECWGSISELNNQFGRFGLEPNVTVRTVLEPREFDLFVHALSNHAGEAKFNEYLAASKMPLKRNTIYLGEVYKADRLPKLKAEIEWSNGDACLIDEYQGNWVFVGMMPNGCECAVASDGSHMIYPVSRLSKPETAEQKALRERDALAERLFDIGYGGSSVTHWRDVIQNLLDAGVKV